MASRASGVALASAAALASVGLGGCISVYHYQPLGGLHRSYALSYKDANFDGLTLGLRCVPGEFLKPAMAGVLCDKMRSLFEGQGARVVELEEEEPSSAGRAEGAAAGPSEAGRGVDYTLVFEAKETYLQRNAWMWPVSIVLLTLFPAEQEYAFEQTVTVLRGDGGPVGRHSFEARFTWFWGAGYWALNKVFNWTVRDDAEDVSDRNMRRDFTRDFYGQVSQVVYDARAKDSFLGLARGGAPRKDGGAGAGAGGSGGTGGAPGVAPGSLPGLEPVSGVPVAPGSAAPAGGGR